MIPRFRFLTKIYHPNINQNGIISPLDMLYKNWSPSYTIELVLIHIQTLFSEFHPDHPMAPEIAHQFKTDRELFEQTAREWTQKFATKMKLKDFCQIQQMNHQKKLQIQKVQTVQPQNKSLPAVLQELGRDPSLAKLIPDFDLDSEQRLCGFIDVDVYSIRLKDIFPISIKALFNNI